MAPPETPYVRESGYALRYRDRRFQQGCGPATDRRERHCLATLLAAVPRVEGAWLDMPAGTGRLSDMLPGPPVQVDRDPAMLAAADGRHPRSCASGLRLPFADGVFAGALCMRLMQHIADGGERIAILAELRRVVRGPVIVSFFDSCTLQHWRRLVRRRLGKPTSGRVAVSRRIFRRELAAAGLVPARVLALRRFVSEQSLVLALPVPGPAW